MDLLLPPLDKLEDSFGGLPRFRIPTPVLFRQFDKFSIKIGISYAVHCRIGVAPRGASVPFDNAVNENVRLLHSRVRIQFPRPQMPETDGQRINVALLRRFDAAKQLRRRVTRRSGDVEREAGGWWKRVIPGRTQTKIL